MTQGDRSADEEALHESVRRGYADIATEGSSCCGPTKSCCGTADPGRVAKAVGYSEAELATLPEGANMGLSCGNPGALAALKPGGRVAVSDLALSKSLPDKIRQSVEARVGCVAGAVPVSVTEAMMKTAGFGDVRCEVKRDYVDSVSQWEDPLYRRIIELLPSNEELGDYVTSLSITARRPREK
jgi:hypothetical protein